MKSRFYGSYFIRVDMFNTVSYASNEKNEFLGYKYGSPYKKEVDC